MHRGRLRSEDISALQAAQEANMLPAEDGQIKGVETKGFRVKRHHQWRYGRRCARPIYGYLSSARRHSAAASDLKWSLLEYLAMPGARSFKLYEPGMLSLVLGLRFAVTFTLTTNTKNEIICQSAYGTVGSRLVKKNALEPVLNAQHRCKVT
ncbi:hypothetical protein NDU88_007408 [Pleurodeles waltl]|uniref:Uncharacterized protein n=1 Tax=Pleurodeles waltl TaxID=8319 RepID=A0AAV7U274_PLEWA|nr:hypothetical protein NDU88_007408 [Pleurodeles waltl]